MFTSLDRPNGEAACLSHGQLTDVHVSRRSRQEFGQQPALDPEHRRRIEGFDELALGNRACELDGITVRVSATSDVLFKKSASRQRTVLDRSHGASRADGVSRSERSDGLSWEAAPRKRPLARQTASLRNAPPARQNTSKASEEASCSRSKATGRAQQSPEAQATGRRAQRSRTSSHPRGRLRRPTRGRPLGAGAKRLGGPTI